MEHMDLTGLLWPSSMHASSYTVEIRGMATDLQVDDAEAGMRNGKEQDALCPCRQAKAEGEVPAKASPRD